MGPILWFYFSLFEVVLLCSLVWPKAHFLPQAGLGLIRILLPQPVTSASPVQGLQLCNPPLAVILLFKKLSLSSNTRLTSTIDCLLLYLH